MPLGAAGVTLFFALSGFLITGLLLEERATTGSVDLRRFYLRRFRRLAPAFLALVVAVVVLAPRLGGWWFEWRNLPPVLLYFGNWVEGLNTDPGVALGALSITWSLAIEEQFYILWPLLILALRRPSRVVVVAMVLAAASLMWRLSLLDASSVRVYYGSDTTAFALLLGAAAVSLRFVGGLGKSRPWGLAAAGALVAWCLSWPNDALVKLGLPVVAAASVAALWVCTGTEGVRVLEMRWLAWLGSRSYGLYLWHGPLLWAMRDHFRLPWLLVAAVGVPVSLALAEVSWRWVESPWRTSRPAARAGRRLPHEANGGVATGWASSQRRA
jgi:peptidoglycan/LPS O-acetylase OafA/YrhL